MSFIQYLRSEWRAIVSFLFFAACFTAVATLLGGCVRHGTKTGPLRVVDYTAELAAHNAKDATILREADSIDAISPAAAPHTAAQRAAVAAAPASDLERIVADLKAAVAALKKQGDADAKTIAGLRKELEDAHSKVDRVIRIGGYAFAAILAAAAAASLFLAAQVPWLGPRISAALGAASASIFALVWAYEWTKQHPWITAISGALIFAAAILAYANHVHDKSPASPRK